MTVRRLITSSFTRSPELFTSADEARDRLFDGARDQCPFHEAYKFEIHWDCPNLREERRTEDNRSGTSEESSRSLSFMIVLESVFITGSGFKIAVFIRWYSASPFSLSLKK